MTGVHASSAGRPLSVGVVSPSLSSSAGGLLPVMQAHAIGMLGKGVHVEAYGLAQPGVPGSGPGWREVSCHVFPPLIRRLGYAPALGRALEESRHDLVHQHGLWQHPSSVVRRWSERTGKPVVISTHGMLTRWAIRHRRMRKRVASLLYEHRNLAAAACLHAFPVEVPTIRALGYRNPVAVIPNGIDLPPPGCTYPRPPFLTGDDRKVLLFLGRLHPVKGVTETIEGWARAIAVRPELREQWVLVVAGWDSGGMLAREMRRVHELGLHDAVMFPGPCFGTDKHALLQHAAAFILASRSEGFPMAVLEAWAFGTPVFMTPECSLPEGFGAGAAIELSADPQRIGGTLAARLPDAGLGAIGAAGRRLVESRFTWSRVIDDLLAVYRWLLTGGPAPACVDLA